MEELEKARQQLDAVRRGQIKANQVCEIVNHWLMLSVYDLAWTVAQKPSKAERHEALEEVKRSMPDFYDDVKTMAIKIYSSDH